MALILSVLALVARQSYTNDKVHDKFSRNSFASIPIRIGNKLIIILREGGGRGAGIRVFKENWGIAIEKKEL